MRLMTKLRLSVDRLCLLIGLALLASCASGFAQNPTPNSPATTPTELQTALHKVQQEIAVAGLLQSLHKAAPHGRIVFKNVHIIDPASGAVPSNQSVVVEDDRIVRVGDPSAASSQTSETMVIDGHGRYLSPGLTDMHVHSSSAASWLLDLSNGVTGVRDMAGFPWLLKIRENVSGSLAQRVEYPDAICRPRLCSWSRGPAVSVRLRDALRFPEEAKRLDSVAWGARDPGGKAECGVSCPGQGYRPAARRCTCTFPGWN